MKKLVVEKEINRKYYKEVDTHKLIITTNNEYDLLLKHIDFKKWLWVDTISSDSLGDGQYIEYSSPEEAIESMLERNFDVFEVDNWEDFSERF